jgi:hypothetical protein
VVGSANSDNTVHQQNGRTEDKNETYQENGISFFDRAQKNM